MPFTPTPLRIPSMTTNYSAENSAFSNLGQTLGSLPGDFRKLQKEAAEREEFARIGKGLKDGTLDPNAAAGSLFALGRPDTAIDLLKIGEARRLRTSGEEASRGLSNALQGYLGSPTSPAPQTTPGSTSSALSPSLISNESGGNWQAQNNEVGAGGTRGHFGRGQFGVARIQEAANAGAIPQGTTPQQFMNSPELQQRAERWHVDNIDQNIRANGFDRLIGQRINGVPITIDGLRAVAHLGGVNGMKKFVETQGGYNPADANGTSLFDYFSRHGGTRSAEADMPARGSAAASMDTGQEGFAIPPGGSAPMSGRMVAQITNSMDSAPLRPAFEAEGTSQPWMGSAILPGLQRSGGGAPQATAQVQPPRRPYDLKEADLPARGAVPAIGQIPPSAAVRYPGIDPNSPDAGVRIGQLASEEARRGLPSGAGVTNFLDNFRQTPAASPAAPAPVNPALAAAPDRVADVPARGAVPTQGNMPMVPNPQAAAASPAVGVPSSELPRPTNAQEAQDYRFTRQMEAQKGQVGKLAAALANPNLPANARAIGEIFLKEALENSKAPDSVKEFMYAKGMGWTTAKNPAEYAKEKTKVSPAEETENRKAAAAAAGLKPGDAGYQGYILTGKMPREDMGPLTATDKKAIIEADEAVANNRAAIGLLDQAISLSPQAYEGPTAGIRGQAMALGGSKAGLATVELNNVVTSNALASLKTIFGGNPTEGERKILLDIQGSANMPHEARVRVFQRAKEAAERRLDFNQQRANEMRGGTYYKPGGGTGGQQQRQAIAAPAGAVDFLRANPGAAAQFDAKYGPGSAAQVLGR